MEKCDGKEQKNLSWGCALKLFALLLLLGFSLYKGCTSCLDENRKQYNDEYWSSVAREKKMREAGLDDFADIEKKNRQKNMEIGYYDNKNNISHTKAIPHSANNKQTAYEIISKDRIFVLDTINGNKILNKKATEYFGKNHYYGLSKEDDVFIIKECDKWVKIRHTEFPQNSGWIEKEYIGKEVNLDKKKQAPSLNDYNGSEQQKKDLEMIDEYMKEHPDF